MKLEIWIDDDRVGSAAFEPMRVALWQYFEDEWNLTDLGDFTISEVDE